MRSATRGAGAACWLLAMTGCAGNGEGLDANGRPIGSGGPGGPLIATYESIQANVFTPVCTGCHAGATAPQGLRLDATNAYDLLVGVASNEVPALQRVAPGDPDRSYLVQKLEGSAAVGGRMPLGGPYLDRATLDVIRQWITDGAMRETTSASLARPFALVTSAPANGDVLTVAPTQLVLAFSRELDAARLAAARVDLQRLSDAGGDATHEIAVDAQVPGTNPRALVIRPHAMLAPGRYVLQVDGNALADTQGTFLGREQPAGPPQGVRVVFELGGPR